MGNNNLNHLFKGNMATAPLMKIMKLLTYRVSGVWICPLMDKGKAIQNFLEAPLLIPLTIKNQEVKAHIT